MPPPSQDVADATDASTSQVDISVGNTASAGSQISTDHALPSPSVSLSSPWGPLSSVHGAKRIFLDVCCGVKCGVEFGRCGRSAVGACLMRNTMTWYLTRLMLLRACFGLGWGSFCREPQGSMTLLPSRSSAGSSLVWPSHV